MEINKDLINSLNSNTSIPNYYGIEKSISKIGDCVLLFYRGASQGAGNVNINYNLSNFRGILMCCGYGYNIQASYIPMSFFKAIANSLQFNVMTNTYNQGPQFVGIKYVNDTTIYCSLPTSLVDNVVRCYGIY